MTEFIFGLASPIAYLAVFMFLILCGAGIPIPEDTILIAAGYLAHSGVVRISVVLFVCYIGVIGGDTILYYIGRKYGQRVINNPKFLKLIPVYKVDKIRRGFHRWHHWMIFFARFLVGFRAPTFILSGVMKIPFKKFIVLDCIGGLLSVPLFVGLGYLFAEHVDSLRRDISHIQSWVIAGIILAVAIYLVWKWLRTRKEDAEEEAIFLWEPHLPHFHRDENRKKENN